MIGKSITPQWRVAGVLLCGALGMSACATARPPASSFSYSDSYSQMTVRPAAQQYALEEMRLAQEQLADARSALNVYEYERARRSAEQALANAQLAEVRAETESTRQTARDLRLTVEAVRDEAVHAAATRVYSSSVTPVELQLAIEELDRATIALNLRDYERARRLADQALADAQRAEVRAATESEHRLARDLRLSSETVRAEALRAPIVSSYSPVELRLAREELDSARTALSLREYDRARRLADQALVDARLAEARAGTESVRQAAYNLRLSIETLRDDAARLAALY